MSHAISSVIDAGIDALRAALAAYTQDTRLIRLHTRLGPDVLTIERFDGFESVSGVAAGRSSPADRQMPAAGFSYEILALSTDAHLDPDELLASAVLLELLCADSRTALRPFHGHVTSIEQLGSNGGLARYRLTVEPWLAFLGHRRDSYVFQDQTVIEIIDELLGDYRDDPLLHADWRWQLQDASIYPQRSLIIQYRESDLQFLHRLLAAEGLYAWFEHEGDRRDPTFGRHRLVIADHVGAFAPDLGIVRFHRASTTEADDSFQQLDAGAAVGSNRVVLGSWDYVSLDTRPVEAESHDPGGSSLPSLTLHDSPGQYRYPNREQGQRLADLVARSEEVGRRQIDAGGSHRRLAPGSRMTISQHPTHDGAALITLSVQHAARNNLPVDFSRALQHLLGTSMVPALIAGARQRPDDEPLYRNRAVLLPAAIPYAPSPSAKPTAQGLSSAIVVGLEGAAITTDRDHRIKVQFHWQRGSRSASRESHPAGDDNAPGNDGSGTWVRVATPVAGANWGGVFVPRIGQEVLIEHVDGDIDRPVVIGAVYNGRGRTDAPGNRIGQTAAAASANAPAWHAGNRHPGVLSGIKSQALGSSRSGQGDHSQLVFDDSTDEARLDLQTTQANTVLTLGYARHQIDNQRSAALGLGTGLATDAYGSLRAGQGLLITADARAGGTHAGHQARDAREAIQQLADAEQLAQALADVARKQNADLASSQRGSVSGSTSRAASNGNTGLNTIDSLNTSQAALRGHTDSSSGLSWSEPMIAVSAPGGIVTVTPDAMLHAVGSHLTQVAGHAIETLAQGATRVAAKDGIVLFTHGADAIAGSPEPLSGIQLHAAQGPVSLQAQSDRASLAALKDIRVSSTSASVTLQAKDSLLLTAQGAYIRLQGGNIEVHAPGKVSFKGAMKQATGAQSVTAEAAASPKAKEIYDEQFQIEDERTGAPVAFARYRIVLDNGLEFSGVTDAEGRTARITNAKKYQAKLHLE